MLAGREIDSCAACWLTHKDIDSYGDMASPLESTGVLRISPRTPSVLKLFQHPLQYLHHLDPHLQQIHISLTTNTSTTTFIIPFTTPSSPTPPPPYPPPTHLHQHLYHPNTTPNHHHIHHYLHSSSPAIHIIPHLKPPSSFS